MLDAAAEPKAAAEAATTPNGGGEEKKAGSQPRSGSPKSGDKGERRGERDRRGERRHEKSRSRERDRRRERGSRSRSRERRGRGEQGDRGERRGGRDHREIDPQRMRRDAGSESPKKKEKTNARARDCHSRSIPLTRSCVRSACAGREERDRRPRSYERDDERLGQRRAQRSPSADPAHREAEEALRDDLTVLVQRIHPRADDFEIFEFFSQAGKVREAPHCTHLHCTR